MRKRKEIIQLIIIMFLVVIIVGGTSIYLLYQTAFRQAEERMKEIAINQASLINEIAKFNRINNIDYPGGSFEATLSQLKNAHEDFRGFGETGEFTLASIEGNFIVFLLNHRHGSTTIPSPVSLNSDLAEPMRRSLSGKSGTMVGLDYRGETVLAAFVPVEELNLGVVAKIDLSEIRHPFIQAILYSLITAMIIIFLGSLLFIKISNPLFINLEKSELQFRNTFEQAAVGIAHSDTEGSFILVNEKFSEIVGYTQNELRELTFKDLIYPEDLEPGEENFSKLLDGALNTYSQEKRYVHKNGSIVWVNLTVSIVREKSGDPVFFIRVVEDISRRKEYQKELEDTYSKLKQSRDSTINLLEDLSRENQERKKVAEALSKSEERFRHLSTATFEAIAFHEGGVVIEANKQYFEMFGYEPDELLGKQVIPLTVAPEARRSMIKRVTKGSLGPYESIGQRKDGTRFPMEIRVREMEYKGRKVRMGAIMDISERKLAEERLSTSAQQLRSLAAHLQSVREEERKVVAREIHDEFGQVLSALKMNLSIIEQKVKNIDDHIISREITEELINSKEIIAQSVRDVRRLITELRPEVLDIHGLIPALEWQIEEFSNRTKLKADFSSNVNEITFDQERDIAIFRIVQEALNNIANHAKATKVRVDIRKQKNELVLKIKDNGIGFNIKRINKKKSFGLLGIRERTLLFGGNMEVKSDPDGKSGGKGTELRIKIPFKI